ncbi:MAG TPA: tetratricopeptide repeat protein [Pyrinomonadaceae bacterium]
MTRQSARSVDSVNLNVGASNTAATNTTTTAAANTTTTGGSRLAEAVENKKASLREEIRSDPDNPKPHASLAQLLFIQGQYSESEKEAREAIRLDPDFSQPHYTLAFLLKKQNKTAESEAERKRADELAAKGQ